MSFSHPATKRIDHYHKRTTGYSDVQDLLQWNRRVKVEGDGKEKQKYGTAALIPGGYYQPPPKMRRSANNGGRESLVRPLLMDKAPPVSAHASYEPSPVATPNYSNPPTKR